MREGKLNHQIVRMKQNLLQETVSAMQLTLRGTKGFLMDCLEQHNDTSLISCYYLG